MNSCPANLWTNKLRMLNDLLLFSSLAQKISADDYLGEVNAASGGHLQKNVDF